MRVDGRGLVDRTRPVRFSFDGRFYEGYQGDTLASALLANGVRLFGRSFKYHRPRGVFTAGSEEPNALVTVGRGAEQTPNIRATVQEIFAGLEARSQNRWPSLKYDLLAANDVLSPFLSAGFYYKTFMWPRSFWEKLYEPLIRRAAGLGALSGAPDRGVYDTAWANCDVLVVGAGPAGLSAALTAARSGLDVLLVDENPAPGGRLTGEDELIDGAPATDWVADVAAQLAGLKNVRVMCRTTVTGVFDHGTFSALQRSATHVPDPGDAPLEVFWRIVAKACVLCTGALERPIAFPGNDRPGVMLAGAVRRYLHQYGVAAGTRVAVFTNSDDGRKTADDLRAAGVDVVALVETRAGVKPGPDHPTFVGSTVTATRGRLGLREIRVEGAGGSQWIKADCLAVSGGWNPTLHLASHTGARPVWNAAIASFVPSPGALLGFEVAGAAAGVFSTKGAIKSGRYRAKLILEGLGAKVPRQGSVEADDTPPSAVAFWQVPAKGRAWIDLQNDVTVKDVELAARENYASAEHMKRYTTLGMAPDQGKSSNVLAMAVLAAQTGRSIAQTGTTTFRPPYSPVAIGAMGANGKGRRFAAERLTPSHQAALDRGAPMVEVGLWLRPSYFPRTGETTWRQSCDREVAMVRKAVGVSDVSTLGKIEVHGKNAAQFLDFVYTNKMSSLKVGRARYGLMLREDGFVMDDGTCARIGRDRYVLTTTTAAAGAVMAHLEFVQQVLRPDWDLRLLSATDHWAQLAVTGPAALETVNHLLDQPISREELPFMGHRQAQIGGVDGRIFRISFSGELGFELAVPARFGDSLFRLAVAHAETLGGGAYGMEALNVLRLEKGFLTHAEINGRVTADDLGLGRMLSPDKDFVGKRMATRPGLVAARREQLVGLRPVGAVKALSAGARLFEPGAGICHENMQGAVTSAAFSPTLGHFIGLALLEGGRNRMGETIRVLERLRGLDTLCEVVSPVFFDPDGGRMRG